MRWLALGVLALLLVASARALPGPLAAPVVYAPGADGDGVRIGPDGSFFQATLLGVPGARVTYDELFTLTNTDARPHVVLLGGVATNVDVLLANGGTLGKPFVLAPGESVGASVVVHDAVAALAMTTSVS